MISVTALRAGIVLAGMLVLPGWAALSLSSLWRRWDPLQRWVLAVGLSIAFYPVFFYGARLAVPFLTLGPYKMGALLLLFAAVIGWRMRRDWREQFELDRFEWIAVVVFGLTIFTRFWIIRHQSYPAWSDSLHHALLTRLTAVQGRLPRTMEPYFPIPLGEYHLGLYSLTATAQWLAQVPAHTALLWTAQVLNGLCGLGVYLVLDRKMGRVGAIVGAVTVGLLSHQPAFYVNWGRFTQLSAQTILLIAWLVTSEALEAWRLRWPAEPLRVLWHSVLAAGLTGAVFLLHFRVAAFYLPLLAISTLWVLWKAHHGDQLGSAAVGVLAIGFASLLIIMPAMIEALSGHFVRSTASSEPFISPTDLSETVRLYYEFPWSTVPYLVGASWLLGLGGLCTALGLVRREKLVIASVIWALALYLVGNAYLLGVPLLSLTNLGAILIMLYLPVGLIVGSGVQEACNICRRWWPQVGNGVVGLALVSGLVAIHAPAAQLEPHRFFLTEEDVAAMEWIRHNTPEDARFAVNTYFWLPRAPHGTDAGYWIPYFTGRRTTAGVMLLSFAEDSYVDQVVGTSRAVEGLELGTAALEELRSLHVDYLYVGRRGNFSGPGLNAESLIEAEGVHLVYDRGGVYILQLSRPGY